MGNTCDSFQLNSIRNSFQRFEKTMIVVTLNYGGILKSPFEFYSDQHDSERELSQIFLLLLPLYVEKFNPAKFQWDIGKIDHKLQEERYAPIYNPSVGINKQQNRFVTQEQFKKLWNDAYETATKDIKIDPAPKSAQRKNMQMFDLVCYHTLLHYLYKFEKPTKLQDIQLQKLNVKKYQTYIKKMFSLAFLDQDTKIIKIRQSLVKNKADVIFFQEPTQKLIQIMSHDPNLYIKQKGAERSMIALRKKTFFGQHNQFNVRTLNYHQSEQEFYNLNGNKDVTTLVVDNYIFISAHLSSKQAKNKIQVKVLKEIFNKLRQKFPDHQVIFGADANSFIQNTEIKDYYSYPTNSSEITTRKRRTYLQAQFQKGQKVIQQVKDHIFSTLRLKRNHIMTISNSKVSHQTLLPTDKHPFDHFMVACEVKRPHHLQQV